MAAGHIAFRLHASARRTAAAHAGVELDFDPPAHAVGDHDERRELLAAAFVRLPAPQQTVLGMHYLEETSAAQVAALLGLSVKAVEDRLYQARRALRESVERELRELLAPRRPDAARFREAVARRVAELERAPKLSEAPSDGLRKAAALLPPELGAIATGAGKAWSAALLLPALALASLFGAFFASARSIGRSTRDAGPSAQNFSRSNRQLPLPRNSAWRWGSILIVAVQFGALALVAGPGLLGGARVVERVVGLVVHSMLTLALHVRGLALAGLQQRALVLRVCLGVPTSVFLGCFLWTGRSHADDGRSTVGISLCGLVVLGGQALLASLHRSELTRLQVGSTLALSLLLGGLITGPHVIDMSSPARIRAYVESERLSTEELRGWEQVAASVEALAAVGEPASDLTRLRAQLEAAIDGGTDAHLRVWTADARMGLIDVEHWRTLASRRMEAYRLDWLLGMELSVRKPDDNEYELHMLLATRELSAEQRERLVRRVEAAWPGAEEGGGAGRGGALCPLAGSARARRPRGDAPRGRSREPRTPFRGSRRVVRPPGRFHQRPDAVSNVVRGCDRGGGRADGAAGTARGGRSMAGAGLVADRGTAPRLPRAAPWLAAGGHANDRLAAGSTGRTAHPRRARGAGGQALAPGSRTDRAPVPVRDPRGSGGGAGARTFRGRPAGLTAWE